MEESGGTTEKIGERICKQRKRKRLTQQELADKMYIQKSTILAYENNKVDIKGSVITELDSVASFFGHLVFYGHYRFHNLFLIFCKSVILYRVVGTEKTVIYGNTTKAIFGASDTNSSFDMYYEIGADEKDVAYYLIVVSDHAVNVAKKKLISQYSLLTWFHTSIERSLTGR